ncbi:hypothetical protein [Salinimicrobium gaetbulicola]|uniref:Secreted protein n=1 Tax=Salinimicrobium gaetbulicola TaxID=999702 RepID=A0ABW3ICE5_9FLAO
MKKNILFSAIFLLSMSLMGQVDQSTTTVKAPDGLLTSPQTGDESKSLLRTNGNHSLSNKRGLLNSSSVKLGEEKEPSFSMRTDNGLMTFKPKDFAPKAFTKDKEIKAEYHKDQYLGDLKTGGGFVELYCRDHEYVDGDRIRIYVNGEMIHNNIALGAGYHPILVRLNMGFNSIEFEALNQGTSGPNTAELRIFDENGMEMAKKEWNLITGGKANLIVVKQ